MFYHQLISQYIGRGTSLLGIGNSLITDKEVQILDTPLTSQMTWFASYWWWSSSTS
jgi:hypothetical protein